MSVPFVYVNDTLTLVLNGKTVQVTAEHPSYGTIKAKLATATEDELVKLTDVKTAVENFVGTCCRQDCRADDILYLGGGPKGYGHGKHISLISVINGQVYFNGKPVHNALSTRIVEFMKEGLPFVNLLRFMENVEQNPSHKAKEELFDFLQHKNLPITEDGCFLAYKAVCGDFLDKYTCTISNKVGTVVEVPRNTVDDDREVGCSNGLHAGTLDYAAGYGGKGDRMLIVKINPCDVVSVPKDCSFQKLRCCRYEVVSEYQNDLVRPLYTQDAQPVNSTVDDTNYDWGWADDDYDEDEDYCPDCGCDLDDDGGCDCTENNKDTCQCNTNAKSAQPRDSRGRFAPRAYGQPSGFQPKRDSKGRFSR